MGAPEIIAEKERSIFSKFVKRINYLSEITGADPKEVVVDAIEEIIDSVNRGVNETGLYFGNIDRDDYGLLGTLIEGIRFGDLLFEKPNELERADFAQFLQDRDK